MGLNECGRDISQRDRRDQDEGGPSLSQRGRTGDERDGVTTERRGDRVEMEREMDGAMERERGVENWYSDVQSHGHHPHHPHSPTTQAFPGVITYTTVVIPKVSPANISKCIYKI